MRAHPPGPSEHVDPDKPNRTGQPPPKRLRKPLGTYSPEFLVWWARYPRKEAKPEAWEAWQQVDPPPQPEQLDAALDWQLRLPSWAREGGRFVPMPAAYLDQRRWEDEQPDPEALLAGDGDNRRCEPKGYQGLRDLTRELQAEGRLPK